MGLGAAFAWAGAGLAAGHGAETASCFPALLPGAQVRGRAPHLPQPLVVQSQGSRPSPSPKLSQCPQDLQPQTPQQWALWPLWLVWVSSWQDCRGPAEGPLLLDPPRQTARAGRVGEATDVPLSSAAPPAGPAPYRKLLVSAGVAGNMQSSLSHLDFRCRRNRGFWLVCFWFAV